MLKGLSQIGDVGGPDVELWSGGDKSAHREIADTYPSSVNYAEHDKPVFPPEWAGRPQGKLWGVRVWDAGESECRSVMERIGVEAQADMTSRESEQTSGWSLFAREFDEPS